MLRDLVISLGDRSRFEQLGALLEVPLRRREIRASRRPVGDGALLRTLLLAGIESGEQLSGQHALPLSHVDAE